MVRMRKPAVLFGLVVTLVARVLAAQGQSNALVRIETTLGNIDIEVDPVHAPITFAALAGATVTLRSSDRRSLAPRRHLAARADHASLAGWLDRTFLLF
jgi:hypothetical protein